MQIYKPDNTLLIDIPVNDSSFAVDEIMNEDILTLEYELVEHLDVPVDSYCVFMGKTYYLLADSDLVKDSERKYRYKLVMYTDASKSKDVKYGFATVSRTTGQPPIFDVAKKIEFSLTGKPIDFVQLWVDNMNESEGTDDWEVGDCIDAPLQTLDFNDQDCFNVLGQITDAFKTEWEITGKTLSFKPLEKGKDTPIPLSYGYDNGLVGGMSRVNYSDGRVINQTIMKGSDRNIVFEIYGNNKLNLSKNATIKFDGNYFSDEPEFVDSPAAIEYKTDANGSYVERSDRTGRARQDSLDCTTIYPMHEGTITSVDPDNNLIFFDDANTIDYKDALIAGNTLQLIPQSGDLVGREFDVNYNHANKRFTLVRIEGNNDLSFPNANLKPKVGDKYAVFKIALPQQYIDEAELTALKACVRHLYNNEVPQYTFEGQLSELYAKQHWLEIGDKLQKGYFVHFSDDKFLPDGADIRIVRTEYYVNKPQQPRIYLSNKVEGKSFTNRQNQFVNQGQTINRESQTQTERLRGTEYLRRALENNTTIDGGLILTSLIQLGYLDSSEVFVNTSGINGIYQNPDDVYAWAGGTLEQAINLVTNPDATTDVANFVVTHGGKVIMNEALVRGRFESNKNGNRIIIDPSSRSIQLKASNNDVLGIWSFASAHSVLQIFNKPSPTQTEQVQINGSTVNMSLTNESTSTVYSTRFGVLGIKVDHRIFPTVSSLADLEVGELYRDGIDIKIKL
ncbi:hypothetical protein JGH11_16200 [Dysgonomonas sp. Marseille-P4677]|uniref:hypothetical protein n=1 Tax=Dysgonomonas sp. Marseille-P4677 TaxID=2364790 RepID=UPI00191316F1|nr:hypothetical protein [Dysgonomonas sp. Marseille-P4677]MBK5722419.1 hypothetical protein [Dysgonomonas sp. Marseille-P4677]